MDGVLSTTVFPEEVDTVLELLDTVEDTVEEVTVSVAWADNGPNSTGRAKKKLRYCTILLPERWHNMNVAGLNIDIRYSNI